LRSTHLVQALLVLSCLCGSLVTPAAAASQSGPGERVDYGVDVALGGEAAKAESIFVSMLSHTRGDARALNNLGNLRLLKGEVGVALAFYERALRGDSLDAGIHLNRGIAFMLLGDDARATEAAAIGMRLAGGRSKADALLGLGTTKEESARAAQRTMISPEEVRALLARASQAVPSDTSRAGRERTGTTPAKTSTWRSAGPRAADGGDSVMLLYWKR
jgi:tetratricopeptide (TPR) repeat protein